ncbi:MAG: hypothetical protein ABH828_06445 [archaeon]
MKYILPLILILLIPLTLASPCNINPSNEFLCVGGTTIGETTIVRYVNEGNDCLMNEAIFCDNGCISASQSFKQKLDDGELNYMLPPALCLLTSKELEYSGESRCAYDHLDNYYEIKYTGSEKEARFVSAGRIPYGGHCKDDPFEMIIPCEDNGWKCDGDSKYWLYKDCTIGRTEICEYGCENDECLPQPLIDITIDEIIEEDKVTEFYKPTTDEMWDSMILIVILIFVVVALEYIFKKAKDRKKALKKHKKKKKIIIFSLSF